MRVVFTGLALLALAACQPAVPDSGSGVGFGSPDDFLAAEEARNAALEGRDTPDRTAEAVDAVISDADSAGGSGLDEGFTAVEDTAAAPETPETTRPAPSGSISDEQNFDAVAERESIESDAERIAANRERYVVIQPGALPERTGSRPNIVAYALATNNPVGEPLYTRSFLTTESRFLRNCASYPSPDLAQQDFLARGGPERDRRGLDPDGDGFACGWDPTPFRAVAN